MKAREENRTPRAMFVINATLCTTLRKPQACKSSSCESESLPPNIHDGLSLDMAVFMCIINASPLVAKCVRLQNTAFPKRVSSLTRLV